MHIYAEFYFILFHPVWKNNAYILLMYNMHMLHVYLSFLLLLCFLCLVFIMITELAVELLNISEHTLPVRVLHTHHVIHFQKRSYARKSPENNIFHMSAIFCPYAKLDHHAVFLHCLHQRKRKVNYCRSA